MSNSEIDSTQSLNRNMNMNAPLVTLTSELCDSSATLNEMEEIEEEVEDDIGSIIRGHEGSGQGSLPASPTGSRGSGSESSARWRSELSISVIGGRVVF
jgi:hypothetical protein